MPAKSAAESILDLRIENAAISERLRNLKSEVDEAALRTIRERLAVLEDRVSDLRRIEDESGKRRWQFILGISVCVITFAANITINLLLLMARK